MATVGIDITVTQAETVNNDITVTQSETMKAAVDASFYAIGSVSDNGGNAQLSVNITGRKTLIANTLVVVGGFVRVTETTNYNGVHEILSIPSTSTIVIDTAYVANDNGEMNIYLADVDVNI